MIKTTYQIKLEHTLYEYEVHKTNDLNYAVYFNDINKYENHSFPIHWHKEMELCIVTKGKIKVLVNQNEIILTVNEGIFINSNVLHGFLKETSECEFISILFDATFIADNNSIYQKYVLPILENNKLTFIRLQHNNSNNKSILDLCHNIFEISEKEPLGFEIYIRNYLSELLLEIFLHNKEYVDNYHVDCKNESIITMIKYIKNNYPSKITVTDIARSANISKRDCYRKFNSFMNVTPINYLEIIRFEHAFELLYDFNKNITEICFECGYSSTSYFCNRFKKITGMTPNQYRNSLEKK